MPVPATKDELLAQLRETRSTWVSVIAAIPDEAKIEPVLPNGWSVKDVMAHVAAYEQLTAEQLNATNEHRLPEGVPDTSSRSGNEASSDDAIDAQIYAAFKNAPLTDVMRFGDRAFQDLLLTIEATPEEHLAHPAPWTDGKAALEVIPGESYAHYQSHLEDVRELADTELV
jgi:uncharacterized damage-inducible protein DinB